MYADRSIAEMLTRDDERPRAVRRVSLPSRLAPSQSTDHIVPKLPARLAYVGHRKDPKRSFEPGRS
jgi:hypothetical protein